MGGCNGGVGAGGDDDGGGGGGRGGGAWLGVSFMTTSLDTGAGGRSGGSSGPGPGGGDGWGWGGYSIDLTPDFVQQLLLLARLLGQANELARELLNLPLEGVGVAALAQLLNLAVEGGELGRGGGSKATGPTTPPASCSNNLTW